MLANRNEVQPPDLILLDICMPGIDGYDTCRELKGNPHTSHIPVIFLSALNESESQQKGYDAGAVDYITKPIQFDEVITCINIHLEKQALRKKLNIHTTH